MHETNGLEHLAHGNFRALTWNVTVNIYAFEDGKVLGKKKERKKERMEIIFIVSLTVFQFLNLFQNKVGFLAVE